MQPSTVSEEAAPSRFVLVVVVLGVMIAQIDATIVILALPAIMADLHTDLLSVVWVTMAYLLTLAVLGPEVGRLGDMFGRVRMYNVGFGVFTLGSVLCGLAQTGPMLIGLRVLQGVGGALISANSGAIIADNVPPDQRGRAYGINAIGGNLGSILGILLGAVLITYVGWRFIFYINLPIGILALVLSSRVLRERSPRRRSAVDWPGMLLMGAGLFLVLYGLVGVARRGWATPVAIELAGGVILLALFVVWEGRNPAPMLDLTLFRRRVLTASLLAAFFQALGFYAVFFLVVMYLQGVRALSPFDAALLVAPGYVVGAIVGPLSGRLADRIGARVPSTIGLAVMIAGVLVYSRLGVTTGLWVVVVAAVLSGIGSGFFFSANNSAVMANAPRADYGIASGLLRTLQNVGMVGSFAVALVSTAAAIPRQDVFSIFLGSSHLTAAEGAAFDQGFRFALLVELVPLLLALVLSALRGPEGRGQGQQNPAGLAAPSRVRRAGS